MRELPLTCPCKCADTPLCRLFSSGRIQPVVYTEVFPLERLAEGLGALEKRKTWGKVIVRIRDEKSGTKAKL